MATVVVYPASDVQANWTSSTGANHWGEIDDATPNTATYVENDSAQGNNVDEFTVTAHGQGNIAITQVVASVHARNAGGVAEGGNVEVDLYLDGAWLGYEATAELDQNWTNYDLTFSGSWNQTDLTNMKARLKDGAPGGHQNHQVSNLKFTATYGAGSPATGRSFGWVM